MRKVVIVGMDGVPFGMLKGFADSGVMPNVGKVIERGILKQMRSSVPEISSVAWSSIITGAGPGQHGIFGFIDLHPGTYQMRFPNFNDLKIPPFWCDSNGNSVIINVPSTYPVRKMNGVHISGFVSIDFEKGIYPKSLVPKLKDLDYRFDVDAQLAQSSIDMFLEDLDKSLKIRAEVCRYLWDSEDWRNFMLVFTGTDRLMHFLWSAYDNVEHKHHDFFIEHFRKIDDAIGEIRSKLADEDVLVILSDHGFEKLETDVYINNILREEGLLSFSPNEPKLENIDSNTKAFCLEPARIFLNLKGKYPNGNVAADEKEQLLQQIENLFLNFQVDGKKVIKYVFRKEDVYTGVYTDNGPDLVLIGDEGFNLRGATAFREITGKGPFSGKHTYENAFFLSNKKGVADSIKQDGFSVIDAGKIIKSLIS